MCLLIEIDSAHFPTLVSQRLELLLWKHANFIVPLLDDEMVDALMVDPPPGSQRGNHDDQQQVAEGELEFHCRRPLRRAGTSPANNGSQTENERKSTIGMSEGTT